MYFISNFFVFLHMRKTFRIPPLGFNVPSDFRGMLILSASSLT